MAGLQQKLQNTPGKRESFKLFKPKKLKKYDMKSLSRNLNRNSLGKSDDPHSPRIQFTQTLPCGWKTSNLKECVANPR